jgi:hypothetical protein
MMAAVSHIAPGYLASTKMQTLRKAEVKRRSQDLERRDHFHNYYTQSTCSNTMSPQRRHPSRQYEDHLDQCPLQLCLHQCRGQRSLTQQLLLSCDTPPTNCKKQTSPHISNFHVVGLGCTLFEVHVRVLLVVGQLTL